MLEHLHYTSIVQWAQTFDTYCLLHSHQMPDAYGKYEVLVAVGVAAECVGNVGTDVEILNDFCQNQWSFGFLSYDLKNQFYPHLSSKVETLNFPMFYFFNPKFICAKPRNQEWQVLLGDEDELLHQLQKIEIIEATPQKISFEIEAKMDKNTYVSTVQKLQQHIRRGDVYEVNFCQEFFVRNIHINPLALYQKLEEVSPKPFSFFFKWKEKNIIGASPERFLTKRQQQIWAQPIKGTSPASAKLQENESFKQRLAQSEKERSENVMIVDLMRNDLTKIAEPKSVKVEELFGIYTFAQVNQMISTISCKLANEVTFSDILKATFPMGSMTGAPKIRALELIDQYEKSTRGVFSGSVGYVDLAGDFDWNVVIRSMIYDSAQGYLSFQVGSAITHLSIPEQEYEECLLKAKAIFEVLHHFKY